MGTEIKTWQIVNGKLTPIDTTLKDEGRNEPYVFFPALLKSNVLSRTELKKAFVEFDPNEDESKVGYYLSLISSQLGMVKNDFLRQVVAYQYPRHKWEKDNFLIREQYRNLVREVLEELEAVNHK